MKFNEGYGGFKPEHLIDQLVLQSKIEDRLEDTSPHRKEFDLTTINTDPINKKDYHAIFSKNIEKGDTILAVGVGMVDALRMGNHQLPELIDVTKEKGAEVLVTDIRPDNLLIHKDYAALKEYTHTHMFAADATGLPLPDSSIKGVVSSNLINCPPNVFSNKSIDLKGQAKLLLQEGFRVIQPGGFIVVTSFGYLKGKNEFGKIEYNNDIQESQIITLKQLESYFNEAGFIDVRELLPTEEWVHYYRSSITGGQEEYVEAGGFIARKPKA